MGVHAEYVCVRAPPVVCTSKVCVIVCVCARACVSPFTHSPTQVLAAGRKPTAPSPQLGTNTMVLSTTGCVGTRAGRLMLMFRYRIFNGRLVLMFWWASC